MAFEFDPGKSAANQAKHGIDFEVAQRLWSDPRRIILRAEARGESREAILASLGGRVWFGVFTLRKGRVRLISVRPARRNERRIYEEAE